MSCCGSKSSPRLSNKPLPQIKGTVAAQPASQPMMQKPAQFNQLSNVSPPPQVHTGSFTNTPFQQPQATGNQQQWHTIPSPPPKTTNEYGSFNTASSTAFGPSTFNGSMLNGQTPYTTSPQASLLRSASPTALYGQNKGAPQDEGKMSVSIDFGMSCRFHRRFIQIFIVTSQVQHSLVL